MIAQDDVQAGIASLRGVGPKTAPLFRDLGIDTAAALLEYLPFRYDDFRFPTPAARLGESGGEENAVGRITGLKERRVRGLEIVEARLADDSGAPFIAKWIGRNRYVYGRFREGMRLFVRGRVERLLSGPVVNVGHYAQLGDDEEYRGELVPVYRASKDLASRKIAAVLKKNLEALIDAAPFDPVPPALAKLRRYGSQSDAYRAVHAPRSPEEAQRARERFVFGEFLGLATAAQLRRNERERDHDARALLVPAGLLEQFEATLPFALTGAQRRVDLGDLERHEPRRSDEPPSARRRRERQDARRSRGDRACGAQRHPVGADGADRVARMAAREQARAAAPSIRRDARSSLRQPERALAQLGARANSAAVRPPSRSARTRSSPKASTSRGSGWQSSTSSIASASSSALVCVQRESLRTRYT